MDTQDIVIEQAKDFSRELAEAIQHLAKQEGNRYQLLSDDDLREMLQSPQSFLFIARHVSSGEIVGMIMAMIYRIPYTKKAYIDDVVVDEKFRKQGIATKLLETAVEVAKKHHVSYIMLTANLGRIAGIHLYEKLGFKKRDSNVYRLEINHAEI